MSLISHPLVEKVIGCAIEVHRALGPGLLESAYRRCLAYELMEAGVPFSAEVQLPVFYKGVHLDCGYRADLVVDGWLLVEIKSVERLLPIFTAQTLTYMKLAGARQGLIINFNTTRLTDGVKSLLGAPVARAPAAAVSTAE